jgi:type I protein arginine methyltransferase
MAPPRLAEMRAYTVVEDDQKQAPASDAYAKGHGPNLYVVPPSLADDDSMLGQFIPIHYHYQMLDQEPRIGGFEKAIDAAVKPGMKVVELGGGTGVLSFFAARAGASKVWCVERVPHVAQAARRFLEKNGVSEIVEVVASDATEFLPPEPVDVVVCEMLHTAMIREKQLAVIASFKERYLAKFGGPLPRFVPEAAVLAVQPVHTTYDFHGFEAHVPMFIDANNADRVSRMGAPALYATFEYAADYATTFEVDCVSVMEHEGTVNSLRFVTKNLLAILPDEQRSIDWDMLDLVVPLAQPLQVKFGDVVRIRFSYRAGDSLLALAEAIEQG